MEKTIDRRHGINTTCISRPYKIGEQVIFLDSISARILNCQKGKYLIAYIDQNNTLQLCKVFSDELSSLKGMNQRTGDSLEFDLNKVVLDGTTDSVELVELYTPQYPQNKLIRFTYRGKVHTAELLEISNNVYVLRMVNQNGKDIIFYVPKSDIVE